MKAKTFLKFLVLFLALGLSACGGKNKKDEGTNGNVAVGVFNTNTAASSGDWGTFVNQVAGGNFQQASTANSVAQWKKYSNVTDLLNYTPDSGGFEWCWGNDCFEDWDTSYGARRVGSSNEVYRNTTFAFDAELGNNLQELLNNIVARMRSASNIKKCVFDQRIFAYDCRDVNSSNFYYGNVGTTRWYFEYSNRAYIVDTKYPLAANPVAILKKDTNEGFSIQ